MGIVILHSAGLAYQQQPPLQKKLITDQLKLRREETIKPRNNYTQCRLFIAKIRFQR